MFFLLIISISSLPVFAQLNKIDSLENLLQNHTKEDTIRVILLNEIANEKYRTETDKTILYTEEAYSISVQTNYSKGEAESLRLLGICHYYKSNYPLAYEYYKQSLEVAENINNKNLIAKCYNNIGLLYWKQENFAEAENYSLKSLKINEELNNQTEIAWCLTNLGGITFGQKKYSEALNYYQKTLEVSLSINNKTLISNCYKNIGIIYSQEKNYNEALKYFQEALNLSIETDDKYVTCQTYINFGNVYFKMKNYSLALDYTNKSMTIAKELDFLDLLKINHEQLSEIYAATNNFQKAYEHQLIFKSLSDSIFKENNLQKITVKEYQYQYEKEKQLIELEQQKKDAINEQEVEKQRSIRNAYFFGFILTVLFLIALSISFIQNKKAHRNLALQKKQIEEKNAELFNQQEEIVEQAEELKVINQELEKLSIVASETDNAIFIMDKNCKFEWVNEGCKKLYGYEFNDFIQKYPDIFTLNPEPQTKESILKCIDQKESVIYQSYTESNSGEIIWVQTTLTPIFDYKKSITKIIAINSDISKLKKIENELKNKNESINGSIRYAKTIQQAILPESSELDKIFENFIIFRPKDVVSGDFYWFSKTKNKNAEDKTHPYFFALADCTGHGVPGAFMSMIGNTLLNEIVNEKQIYSPKDVLTEMDNKLISALHQDKTENINGMDICLCRLDFEENTCKITFSAAKRHLFYYKKVEKEIITLKGDIKTVGGIHFRNETEFSNHEIFLKKGDIMYLCSDGIFDQNNKERKRFGKTQILNILTENIDKKLEEQKTELELKLDKWQGEEPQRDDITFIGIKI
ncbi:MAG: tetratricopeptide repeat protein [Bacteroidales bacterium]|nr:tetratricopeptide repeat protein [Bacteroidales bacterium]